MMLPVEAILFVFLLIIAVAIVRLRDLFAVAMLASMFGLISAGMFTLMDAVDVAFTEAAVGAGFSTVLLLGTLSLLGTQKARRQGKVRILPFLVVLITGAALVYGTFDMPHYGDPEAPIHGRTAPGYIAGTSKDIGIPNIVTAVLGSYRGYDTLGETVVILVAGLGVMMLLGGRHFRDSDDV